MKDLNKFSFLAFWLFIISTIILLLDGEYVSAYFSFCATYLAYFAGKYWSEYE